MLFCVLVCVWCKCVCVCVRRKRVCGVSVYCVFRLCVSVYVLIIHTCHLAPRELFGPSFGYFFFLPLSLLGAIQAHSLTLTHTLSLYLTHTLTHSHTDKERKGFLFISTSKSDSNSSISTFLWCCLL